MDQRLEVGVVDWPASGWEAALMMINRDCAVQGFVVCFADLAKDEQYLLMYLLLVSHVCVLRQHVLPMNYPRQI